LKFPIAPAFLEGNRWIPRKEEGTPVINLPVYIFYSDERITAHTLNLGLGGIKLHADYILPLSKELLIQVLLGKKVIWSKGRPLFVQVQPDEVNFSCIQFLDMPEKGLILLQEFLSSTENSYGLKGSDHAPLQAPVHKDREDLKVPLKASPLRRPDGHEDKDLSYKYIPERIISQVQEMLEFLSRKADALRGGHQDLQELKRRFQFLSYDFLDSQEREKKMLADGLRENLAAMLQGVSEVQREILGSLRGTPDSKPERFHETAAALRRSIERFSGTLEEVRPSALDESGILAALDWYCPRFRNHYPHLRVEKEIDIREEDIPDPLKTWIFRMIQEALRNIAEHSRAEKAILSLVKRKNRIYLGIEDNGKGFDSQERLRQGKGTGLIRMKERAELSGGFFSITSKEGSGTFIQISWSLDPSNP
jgi:signal transduction histidine kinase